MKTNAAYLRRLTAPALLVTYLLGFFALLHSRTDGLTERDGYFHARYAQMLPQRRLSRSFPWTQASPWKFRFADKEFLFHLLLSPFARGDEPIRGALVFSVLLSAGIFAAFHVFLRAHGARAPALFTFVLASLGGPFLLRVSFLRAHVLSVLLIVLALHFLIRGRWKALGVLGFVYSWSYAFPFVLPLVALPFLLGQAWAEGRFDWKCLAAALGGVLAGLIFHPYTPHSLESVALYFKVFAVALGKQGGVQVAREFAPYSTRSFLFSFPLLTVVLAGLGLSGWATKRRLSAQALGLLCAAACAVIGTMVFMRAVEYAAPLAAAALAFAVRDLLDKDAAARLREALRERPARIWLPAGVLAALLCAAHIQTLAYTLRMSAGNEPPRFRKAAAWMTENTLPDETVVNLWWDDFPDLFYHGHRQRFVVGLDPTYMLRHDREAALRLEGMRMLRAPIDAKWLARTFAARYMILRAPNVPFYPQLLTRAWRPVYRDEHAAIFALTGPAGPPDNLLGLPSIPALF